MKTDRKTNRRGDQCRANRFASAKRLRFVLPAAFFALVFTLLAAAPASAFRPSPPRDLVLDSYTTAGAWAQWAAPASDGGFPISHYLIRFRILSGCGALGQLFPPLEQTCYLHHVPYSPEHWLDLARPNPPKNIGNFTSHSINNSVTYPSGKRYSYQGVPLEWQVAAVNTNGDQSLWTTWSRVISGTPARPYFYESSGIQNGIRIKFDLGFGGDTDFIKPTSFKVRWRKLGPLGIGQHNWLDSQTRTIPGGATAREYDITGLENGARYGIQVAASTIVGSSQWTPVRYREGRAGSSNATLSSLSLKRAGTKERALPLEPKGPALPLKPEFSAETLTYTTYTTPEIPVGERNAVKFSMRPSGPIWNISVGDTVLGTDTNGAYVYTPQLADGVNTFHFVVTPTDLVSTITYTVTVPRTHAGLSAMEAVPSRINEVLLTPTNFLTGDKLPLRPAFAPGVRTYDISVGHPVAELRLRLAAGALTRSIAYADLADPLDLRNYPEVYAQLEDINDARIAGFPLLADGITQIEILLTDIDDGVEKYLLRVKRDRLRLLPDVPTLVRATAGAAKIDAAWAAPGVRHGAEELPLEGYRVRWRFLPQGKAQGYGNWQDASGDNEQGESLAADASAYTIRGRLYFLPYEVQVAAENADGISLWVPAAATV
ncbi:MAG: hypothetical protein OD817_03085, partial [Gammaproteobacteria bacterium]